MFFKDELIQVIASPEGHLDLVSQKADFHKPSPEEVAERDISLLKLVPPQALVYPTESIPLRIFVSRSLLLQRTKNRGEEGFVSSEALCGIGRQFSYSDWCVNISTVGVIPQGASPGR